MLLSSNKIIYSLLFIFFINFFFQFFGPLLYFKHLTFGLSDIQDNVKTYFILNESYYPRLVSFLIIWIAAFILPIFLVFFFFENKFFEIKKYNFSIFFIISSIYLSFFFYSLGSKNNQIILNLSVIANSMYTLCYFFYFLNEKNLKLKIISFITFFSICLIIFWYKIFVWKSFISAYYIVLALFLILALFKKNIKIILVHILIFVAMCIYFQTLKDFSHLDNRYSDRLKDSSLIDFFLEFKDDQLKYFNINKIKEKLDKHIDSTNKSGNLVVKEIKYNSGKNIIIEDVDKFQNIVFTPNQLRSFDATKVEYNSINAINRFLERLNKSKEFALVDHLHNKYFTNLINYPKKEFLNGETYLNLKTKFIPRLIYPNKPIENLGNKYGKTYYQISQKDNVTSQNLHQIIEGYINYGTMGLVLHGAVLAMFFILIFILIVYLSKNTYETAYLVSVGVYLIVTLESNFSSSFGGFFIQIVLYFFYLFLKFNYNFFNKKLTRSKYL